MEIRLFRNEDAEGLAVLFEEMQTHYSVPCPPREAVVADLKALASGVRILVAVTDRLTGFATFSAIYPGPGLRGGLFLKDLFVSYAMRRQGTGRALLRTLAALAVREGYGRIDWTADRNDPAVLGFYEGLGARPETAKVFFRLTGDALDQFAEAVRSRSPGSPASTTA